MNWEIILFDLRKIRRFREVERFVEKYKRFVGNYIVRSFFFVIFLGICEGFFLLY